MGVNYTEEKKKNTERQNKMNRTREAPGRGSFWHLPWVSVPLENTPVMKVYFEKTKEKLENGKKHFQRNIKQLLFDRSE